MKLLMSQSEVFTRGIEDVITTKELDLLLSQKKQLRIKHGIDATSSSLHIGHATVLWKMRALQECGHKAILLLGDTTTEIGDPSGKSKTRPILSRENIEKNIENIEKQAHEILLCDSNLLEIRRNSEWYGSMKVSEFLQLLSQVTHASLIERDMFQKRMEEKNEIYMHEMLYPILQGYDSVALQSDITIIGSDQLFNEHMGRFFQERFGQKPQIIISLSILPGLDGGEKMSKSLGNYIGLGDTPEDKFGKAMRTIDSLITPYLRAYTDVSLEDITVIEEEIKNSKNPMEAKLFFAESLVRRYHGEKVAQKAKKHFIQLFSKKEISSEAEEIKIPHKEWKIIELLITIKPTLSKSEARRLVTQGAVDIGGRVAKDPKEIVTAKKGIVIKVGKKSFYRIA